MVLLLKSKKVLNTLSLRLFRHAKTKSVCVLVAAVKHDLTTQPKQLATMNNEHNLKSSNRNTRKSDDKKAEGLLLHLENNYGYTAAAIT